ncbi:MAG: hypothetical protein MUC50_11075 [Myxococcota bacterium]|nr:hypothetical protein [Myxococcota bacterium]
MSYDEHFVALRSMLAGLFDARFSGAVGASHARAQGLVDGYMRALIDLRMTTDRELVQLVHEERDAAAVRAEAALASHRSAPTRVAAHFA